MMHVRESRWDGMTAANSQRAMRRFAFLWVVLCFASAQGLDRRAYSQADAEPAMSAQLQQSQRSPWRREASVRDRRTGKTVLDDPCLGTHWQLLADPSHPERPGRWQPVEASSQEAPAPVLRPGRDEVFRAQRKPEHAHESMLRKIVIRAGDKVIVTQKTAQIDARLWGVALEPARAGEQFDARLLTAHDRLPAVLVALATGPGEAVWLGPKELLR